MRARSPPRVNVPPSLDYLLWSFGCDDHPLRLFSISAPHFVAAYLEALSGPLGGSSSCANASVVAVLSPGIFRA